MPSKLEDYANKYQCVRFERRGGILQMTLHTDGGSLRWSTVEDLCLAFDRDLSLREASNASCERPSPTLACLTVTYAHIQRLAGCYRAQ